MESLRRYGKPPYTVAVIHGGPGAPGTMAPVARELSRNRGVLEPLQQAHSIEGQIEELRSVLREDADPPVTLIGSSWGAMLGLLVAARHPALVKKAILVGSGVFESQYAAEIPETRVSRLGEEERAEATPLMAALNDPSHGNKDAALSRLGAIYQRADAYDPLPRESDILECRYDIFSRVWSEAEALRAEGGFLEAAREVRCPVVAIHGDYDPHPPEGVEGPLSGVLRDFSFIRIEKCGHLPWIEGQAKEPFYAILREALN